MANSLAYGTITITDLADGAQIWTTNQTPTTSNNQYVFTISQLIGDGNADVKVGDLIFSSEYRYTIISVGNTTVTTDYRTSLKGIQGEQGYSLRGSYIRDKWTNTQWTGTYGVIGYTASFSNYDILSSGNQTNGKYTITSWSVGDIFFLTGTATDTGIAYTATYTVTSKPTSNTGTVASSCIAFAHAEKGKDGQDGNGILSKTDYYMLADTMDSTALDTAKAHFPQDVSGSIVSISDAMPNIPFENVTVDIVPIQSGSGDPSPTNVRPITGWTGAKVLNDPKYGGIVVWNQFFLAAYTSTTSGVTFTKVDNYTVRIKGTASAMAYKQIGTTQTVLGHVYYTDSGTDNSAIGFYNDSKGVGSVLKRRIVGKATDNKQMYFRVASGATVDETVNPQIFDLTRMFGEETADYIYSLEQANAGAGVAWFKELFHKDYYPYNAGEQTCVSAVNGDSYNEFSITWEDTAGTVYCGTLDVTRGKLVKTTESVDLADLTWRLRTGSRFSSTLPSSANVLADISEYIGSCLPIEYAAGYSGVTDGYIGIYKTAASTQTDTIYLNLNTIGITDVTTLSEWLTTNSVQLVYPLATPIEYDLTPTEIETFLGQNNVWADAGDVSLTYYNEINAAWQTTLPEANKYARYLWWYYHTIYTNGDETDSEPAIIGIYNDDWADDAVKAQQMAQQAQDTANSAAGAAGTNKTAIDTLQDVIYGTEDEPGLQSEISTLKSNTTVTASSLEQLRTDAVARLNTLESQLGQYQAWIRFDGANGLIIGKEKMTTEEGQEDTSVNPYVLQLEGDCISFYEATDIGDKSKRVGYIQNKLLYIESSIFSDQMDLGNFRFVKQDSGNLSLVWKG